MLWWIAADPRLPTSYRQVLEAADADHPLLLSEISLWEIATFFELGRIELNLSLQDWLEKVAAPPLVLQVGITPAIAAEVANLPKTFHRDPADRILVATARVLGATLLTRDTSDPRHCHYLGKCRIGSRRCLGRG